MCFLKKFVTVNHNKEEGKEVEKIGEKNEGKINEKQLIRVNSTFYNSLIVLIIRQINSLDIELMYFCSDVLSPHFLQKLCMAV